MYCDSHIEFIHPEEDLVNLANPAFLKQQINEELINEVKPDLLFTAVYVESGARAWERTLWTIEAYKQVAKNNGWELVLAKEDIERPDIKLLLHVEDLHMIGDDLEKIDRLFDEGIRSIGLTHNHENQFGGGSLSPSGLSLLGHHAIERITKRSMILDHAHLSPQSFEEAVTQHTHPPFISHAAVQGIYNSPRNISDAMLRRVRENNGYIGIGMAGSFLGKEKASITDVLSHLTYASQQVGEMNVGIGSDLGGIISFLPEGIESIKTVPTLGLDQGIMGENLRAFVRRSHLLDVN